MHVIGIIAEFNPFHNGHEYLITKAREAVGDSRAIVLCVMSGPFSQRGEPSILPKHVRAGQALLCGADVVIELPFTFACAPSERFSFGAVEALLRTGVVTDLAFGVDCEKPEILRRLSEIDFESDDNYRTILKEKLASGMSFPASRSFAIQECCPDDLKGEELSTALRMPNSILALDYLSAVRRLKARFNIHMISRVGDGYSSNTTNEFASASAIRSLLFEKNENNTISPAKTFSSLKGLMPNASLALMLEAYSNKTCDLLSRDMWITDAFNEISRENCDGYAYSSDGLCGYLSNVGQKIPFAKNDFANVSALLQTKHFTMPRIYRALTSILLGQTSDFVASHSHVPYIRVLGFNRNGRYCLKIMGKCAKVPILTNCSDYLEHGDNTELQEVFELDMKATELSNRYLKMPYAIERQTPPFICK